VATRTITANPLPTPSFTRTPTANTCSPAVLSYTNTTNLAAAANDGATFSWDLGDGTTFTGLTPPAHTYTHNGNTFRDFV
jgi:PKD repeat protein